MVVKKKNSLNSIYNSERGSRDQSGSKLSSSLNNRLTRSNSRISRNSGTKIIMKTSRISRKVCSPDSSGFEKSDSPIKFNKTQNSTRLGVMSTVHETLNSIDW